MPSTTSSRLISSVSSFDYLSSSGHSREGSDSSESYITLSDEVSSEEDEILLSFSEVSSSAGIISPAISQGAQSPNTFSDDDYVVFGGVRTPEGHFDSFAAGGSAVANVDSITETLAQLEIRQRRSRKARRNAQTSANSDTASVRLVSQPASPKRNRKRRNAAVNSSDDEGSLPDVSATPSPSPHSNSSSPKPKKNKKKGKQGVVSASAPGLVSKKSDSSSKSSKSPKGTPTKTVVASKAGLGERPIVDDVSEAGDYKVVTAGYEEAVQYVTSVLSDPSPKTNSNLTLLHALIVELGLCPGACRGSTSSNLGWVCSWLLATKT
ncbi:unnamed protein product [Somion occarium]|uniref:Uncharacterized protein n=1 Tax=Somion occarium TaxID=3059160 RepID=A0ABP1D8L4_9APHY